MRREGWARVGRAAAVVGRALVHALGVALSVLKPAEQQSGDPVLPTRPAPKKEPGYRP